MKNNKNIVLVGFMGCGKTTVGKLLALALGYDFVDTDHLVVNNEKTDISIIFKNKGEQYFRKVESIALGQAMDQEGHVVATGGGIVTKPENNSILKRGLVVYLAGSPGQIYNNIKDDKSRPLLQEKDVYGKICSMLEERQKLYQQIADYTVEIDEKTPQEICKLILKGIK